MTFSTSITPRLTPDYGSGKNEGSGVEKVEWCHRDTCAWEGDTSRLSTKDEWPFTGRYGGEVGWDRGLETEGFRRCWVKVPEERGGSG